MTRTNSRIILLNMLEVERSPVRSSVSSTRVKPNVVCKYVVEFGQWRHMTPHTVSKLQCGLLKLTTKLNFTDINKNKSGKMTKRYIFLHLISRINELTSSKKLVMVPLHPCLPFSQRTLTARCTGGHWVRARAVVAHIQWKTVRSSCEILYLAPSTAASTPSVALLPSTGPIPPLQLLSCLLCNGLHVFTHILG